MAALESAMVSSARSAAAAAGRMPHAWPAELEVGMKRPAATAYAALLAVLTCLAAWAAAVARAEAPTVLQGSTARRASEPAWGLCACQACSGARMLHAC